MDIAIPMNPHEFGWFYSHKPSIFWKKNDSGVMRPEEFKRLLKEAKDAPWSAAGWGRDLKKSGSDSC